MKTHRGRKLLGILVALILVLSSLYLLRGPLFGRALARWAATQLSKELGGRFAIQRISGSWIRDVVLTGLQTEEKPNGALRRLACARAHLHWSPWALIRGEGLRGLRTIEIEGLDVTLDFATQGREPPSPG